jgi:hypothetical protein
MANRTVPFSTLKVAERADGRGDLLPFLLPLDVVQGEHVDEVGPEGREDRPLFRRRVGLVPRAELDANDDRFAASAEGGDSAGKGIAFARSFGQALPVEEVDSTIDRRKNVIRGEGGPTVGREAEAADGQTEAGC